MTWPRAVLNVNKFHYLRGGSERYYFDVAGILRARGHRVVEFSMAHASNRPSPQASFFVPEVSWNGTGPGSGRIALAIGVIHSREAERRIEALLESEEVELAHLHNIAHQLSPSILGPLRRRGIPVVQTLHDYKLVCPNYRLFTEGAPCERCRGGRYWNALLHRCNRGDLAGSLLIAIESSAHRLCGAYQRGIDIFLAPSRFLMEKAVAFGVPPDRVRHVPYPIEVRSEAVAATGRAGAAAGDRFVLYAGRLAPEKGIRTLLDAAERAPGAALRIAGTGELAGEVAGRAARLPNVTLLGHLEADAVARLQREAAAVVVPSEWYENQPLAILEAFAAGVPAIASRVGGLPEIVRDGETGLLFPPGDATALAACLERAAREPEAIAAMGRRARALAVERHDPGAHYDALRGAYEAARALAAIGRPWRWERVA